MNAEKLLDTAKATIAQRGENYNKQAQTRENSFQVIADFWTIWLNRRFDIDIKLLGVDAALMMDLMKSARIAGCITHEDSYIDKAGYTALAAEIGLPVKAETPVTAKYRYELAGLAVKESLRLVDGPLKVTFVEGNMERVLDHLKSTGFVILRKYKEELGGGTVVIFQDARKVMDKIADSMAMEARP